jgi:hypothetical protein
MFARLLILLLTLFCFTARFYCALEANGYLAACCEGTSHDAPPSADKCDGCPDFEFSSTLTARLAPGLDDGSILFNHWATRQLFDDVLNRRSSATHVLIPPDSLPPMLMGPREALASHTTSLRGPPVLA